MARKVWLAAVLLLVTLVGFFGWRLAERRAEAKRLKAHGITVSRGSFAPDWLSALIGPSRASRLFPTGDVFEVRLGSRATDESVAIAVQIEGAERLVFERTTKITQVGYAHLANATTGFDSSGNLKRFVKLFFFNAGVTDDTLAAIPPFRNIGFIWLIEPTITDAGILHLKKHSNLQALDVQATAVTAGGVQELLNVLPNCAITLR